MRFYQVERTEECSFSSHSVGRLREALQLSDSMAGERNRQPEKRMKKETVRMTKIERNRYLNTEIVEEISQERRTRARDRKGNKTERVRGVERVTHPSVESTYLLSLSLSLPLSSSSRGYLHLGPTLAAPAIP